MWARMIAVTIVAVAQVACSGTAERAEAQSAGRLQFSKDTVWEDLYDVNGNQIKDDSVVLTNTVSETLTIDSIAVEVDPEKLPTFVLIFSVTPRNRDLYSAQYSFAHNYYTYGKSDTEKRIRLAPKGTLSLVSLLFDAGIAVVLEKATSGSQLGDTICARLVIFEGNIAQDSLVVMGILEYDDTLVKTPRNHGGFTTPGYKRQCSIVDVRGRREGAKSLADSYFRFPAAGVYIEAEKRIRIQK